MALKPNIMNTLALSKWQKGIFFSEQKTQFSGLYTIFHIFEIKGEFNFDRLQDTVDRLILKYPILRSKFNQNDLFFYHVDARSMIEKIRVNSYDELKKLLTPIHLIDDFLFQCKFFILSESESQYLVFGFHHIICDGWSAHLFYDDFFNFYQNLQQNNIQDKTKDLFSEYECVLKNSAESIFSEKQYDYWYNKLSQIGTGHILEYDDLNFDLKQCSDLTNESKSMVLSSDLCRAVTTFCLSFKISEYLVYLAVFVICLKKVSGQNTIPVAVAYANRDMPGAARIITNLVDLLILSNEINNDDSFIEILMKIKNEFIYSLKNQSGLCYLEITKQCNLAKLFPFVNPGFQIFFNFLEMNFSTICFHNSTLNLVEELITKKAKFEFHFEIRCDKKLSKKILNVTYARELFSFDTIDMIVNYYQKWLVDILQIPNEKQIVSKLMW